MNCIDVKALLSAYFDGWLSDKEAATVAAHLLECPECAAAEAALRQTAALCRDLPEVKAPHGFREGVMARVRGRRPAASPLAWFAASPARTLTAIAAVVVLAFAAVPAALLVGQHYLQGTMMKAAAPPGQGAVDAARSLLPQGLSIKDGAYSTAAPDQGPEFGRAATGGDSDPLAGHDRKIIKTADIQLEVASVEDASKRIAFLVEGLNGYVESSTFWAGDKGVRNGAVRVRVPSDEFTSVLERVKELGKVKREDVRGQDVTKQVIDNEATLRNLRRQEERYLDILKQAKNVEEIMRVEQELARIRHNIEMTEGTLRYLEGAVAYSTISIELRQPEGPPPVLGGFWDKLVRALAAGVGFVEAIIFAAAKALPTLVLIVLGWFAYRRWRRARQ